MSTRSLGQQPFKRIGIAGIGLIGGSVALAARRNWPAISVVGFDDGLSAVQPGVVDRVAFDIGELADCDLIVLAVPVPVMPPMLETLGRLNTSAIVTDVGSTKRRVMAAASAAGVGTFIGGHPMAGAEQPGLAHARANLFEGRPWLLVGGQTPPAAADKLEQFVVALGATPRWMTAETHDRTVAYVSHLPQIVAAVLMNVADEAVSETGPSTAGNAFAEMTRLASSPADLWKGICADNADFVAEALDRFVRSLPAEETLGDGEWVRSALSRSGAARARWRAGGSTGK